MTTRPPLVALVISLGATRLALPAVRWGGLFFGGRNGS